MKYRMYCGAAQIYDLASSTHARASQIYDLVDAYGCGAAQIYDLASNTHARVSQIYDLVELTAAVLVQIRGFKETIGKADY